MPTNNKSHPQQFPVVNELILFSVCHAVDDDFDK